jgi:hypothetical protein
MSKHHKKREGESFETAAKELEDAALRFARSFRGRQLLGFFISGGSMPNIVTQLLSNDTTVGVSLLLAEALKGVAVPLSPGPFSVSISDPSGAVDTVANAPDYSTPFQLKANGSGAVGIVTLTVVDQFPANNGLSATFTLSVVAPGTAPPAGATADTITGQFATTGS